VEEPQSAPWTQGIPCLMIMTVSVVMCDHCQDLKFASHVEAYRVADGPTLHICCICQRKPFRKVQPAPKRIAALELIRQAAEHLND